MDEAEFAKFTDFDEFDELMIPPEIPILPLREVVIYPSMVTPFSAAVCEVRFWLAPCSTMDRTARRCMGHPTSYSAESMVTAAMDSTEPW